tara:strand:+ start:594 stop:806 length:213 start_codon:yes stop_codon:yes gene_type:complete
MDLILFIYFCIVFLGLQGLFLFEKETSITLILIGNFLIAYHCLNNFMWDLLILTVMMTIAQITRIWRGVS